MNNSFLTKKEQQRLQKYKKASRGCLHSSFGLIIDENTYQHYLKQGWRNNEINFGVINTEIGQMKLVKVVKMMGSGDNIIYKAVVFPSFPEQTILLAPSKVHSQLAAAPYDQLAPAVKLAEREAYTFEDLTQPSIDFFYREAAKMRKEFVDYCSEKNEDVSAGKNTPVV